MYVSVTTPDEFVAPPVALSVPQAALGVPANEKLTMSLATGAPPELVTVAVTVEVAVPLLMTELGLAETATELLVFTVVVMTSGAVAAIPSLVSAAVMEHVPAAEPAV